MTIPFFGRRRRIHARLVLVSAIVATGVALACADNTTAPVPEQRLAPRPGAPSRDWACATSWVYPDGTGVWHCTYEADATNSWAPPPDWGSSTVDSYDYCSSNPNACGGSTGGGGPSTSEAFTDDTGLPTYTGTLNSSDEGNLANFDCRVVKCPKPSVIVNSPNVQKAAAVLQQMTLNDGKEHGAWLYLNADGTIRVGPILDGGPTSIPALLTPPDAYVIGSIHSHPPGSQWLEGPSPNDMYNALQNAVYYVVRTVDGMYVYPGSSPSGWSASSPPSSRQCC